MSKRLNIIVVPDEGGKSRRYSISILWLKAATTVTTLLLIGIVAGSISYGFLARKAMEVGA